MTQFQAWYPMSLLALDLGQAVYYSVKQHLIFLNKCLECAWIQTTRITLQMKLKKRPDWLHRFNIRFNIFQDKVHQYYIVTFFLMYHYIQIQFLKIGPWAAKYIRRFDKPCRRCERRKFEITLRKFSTRSIYWKSNASECCISSCKSKISKKT